MAFALREAFERSPTWTVIIGGDCPYLTQSYLQAAFKGLGRSDVVVGPALDGGYVLLGSKRYHPELFEAVHWSTDRVLDKTMERASEAHLRVKLLDPLEDVDDLASWERAKRQLNL
jgi:hypothetical protein